MAILFLLLTCFSFANSLPQGLIPCVLNRDCAGLKNATCIKGLCQCDLPYYVCEVKSSKLVNVIGGKCDQDSKCNAKFSKCLPNGKCGCGEKMVASSDRKICLPVVDNLGETCLDSVQCTASAPFRECRNIQCACRLNATEKNGSCYKKIELGDKCDVNDDCFLITNAKCIDFKCTCEATHFASKASGSCLPIAHKIGEECREHEQCTPILGFGAYCTGNRCRCQEMYQYKSSTNKCVRDKFLDENCSNHDDCHQPGNGFNRLACVEGVCKCRSIYQLQNGYCLENVENGGSSTSSSYMCLMFVLFRIYFALL